MIHIFITKYNKVINRCIDNWKISHNYTEAEILMCCTILNTLEVIYK